MPRFAADLDERQWDIVHEAKKEAERHMPNRLTNEEFLVLMANDTSAKWRKGK